tara:strand:+ start:76 stop:468 length:393 start_codon:yes stop_codon:yes gene_type:complete
MSGSSSRRRKRQQASLTWSNAKLDYIHIRVINRDFAGAAGNTLGAVLYRSATGSGNGRYSFRLFQEDGTLLDGTLTSANGLASIVTKINSNAILKTYLRATLIQETAANNIDFSTGFNAGDVTKFSGGAG